MVIIHGLTIPPSLIRSRIRAEFERHRYVDDPAVIDVLVQKSRQSFQEVMNAKHKPLVVIATAPKARLGEVSVHVKDIAKQWKDKKATGDVVFTWMDGDKWSSWLKSMYGIKAGEMPRAVVANHTVRRILSLKWAQV